MESIRPKNILGAAGGGLSHWGHRLPACVYRHIEAELHGTTKEFDQLLAQDLPVLNESLKAKGQQPIEPPPVKISVNEKALNLGGAKAGVTSLTD